MTIRHWPIFVTLALFLFILGLTVELILRQNGGTFVYAIDDPYIHMSMARNFVTGGVWGITPYEFTSSSSSPLWTALLSIGFALVGAQTLLPLFLNIVLALAAIWVVYRLLCNRGLPQLVLFAILVLFVLATPLLAMVMIGMEHLLHLLLSIIFLSYAVKLIVEDNWRDVPLSRKVLVIFLGALMTATRYESLFFLAPVCLLFILRRRIGFGFLLGILSAVPLIAYGLVSVANGWQMLPSSLLLKDEHSILSPPVVVNIIRALWKGVVDLHTFGPFLGLLILNLFLIMVIHNKNGRRFWNEPLILTILLSVVMYFQVAFASLGWFYRYEAYLIGTGIYVVGVNLGEVWKTYGEPLKLARSNVVRNLAAVLLVYFALNPVIFRAYLGYIGVVPASSSIYLQQFQMAQFLHRYYQGKTVGANDVGLISYSGGVRVVDLFGLGTRETVEAKRSGTFDTQFIRDLAQEKAMDIAIVYDGWFEEYGGLPDEWVRVGQWITQPGIVASTTVSFYAVHESEAANLASNLQHFADDLPPEVREAGEYDTLFVQSADS